MKKFNKNDITAHLVNIKESLINDAGCAIDAYDSFNMDQMDKKEKPLIGFFAVLRLIFPEIDCLGSYYIGSTSTTKGAISFLKEICGQVNKNYKKYAAFLYLYYRHGLIHQHEPKRFRYKGKLLEWAISLSKSKPRAGHLERFGKGVQLDAGQFYEDILAGIDIYINLFNVPTKEKLLVKNFNLAICQMRKPLYKTQVLRQNKYLKKTDFNFLKEK